MSEPEVLVIAGEASGDRIAALVARALAAEGVRCAGLGGAACRAAGVEILASLEHVASMGIADVAARAHRFAAATARLVARIVRTPPRAALLVDFTEFNQRIGRILRARGTRVLWCVAPQVWAWRRGRLASMRGAFDRLAVILPFEEALWRDAGHDARYVGHPSIEALDAVRGRIDSPRDPRAIAILPGSRAGEIARHAVPFVEAARDLVASGVASSASVVLAPDLDARSRALVDRCARDAGIAIVRADPEHGAASKLGAFGASICASGTASLEAALAGAAPVVAYRLDPLAFAVAKRLVRTPHVALPNVLLRRRAYPELVQDDVTPAKLVAAARGLMADVDRTRDAADEVRAILAPPSSAPFGRRVAELVLPWIRSTAR